MYRRAEHCTVLHLVFTFHFKEQIYIKITLILLELSCKPQLKYINKHCIVT